MCDNLALITDFFRADIAPEERLLGTDFLCKFGAVIDLKGGSCVLMGKKLPLQLIHPLKGSRSLTVEKDLTIPLQSEVIILGNVSGACLESMEGMLEPSGALSSHFDELVARVVSKVEKGLIPIRLINVAEHAHTLRWGMFVGTFCPDIHVEEELTVMVDTHEDQAG